MTARIKNSVCSGEVKYCLEMSEGWRGVLSILEVEVPMYEAMKWLEAFNFNFQDFSEAVDVDDRNVSAVLTSMSGIGTGSRCVTLKFSLVSYSISSTEDSYGVDFWDKFVEKIVDSIRCAVVEHDLDIARE